MRTYSRVAQSNEKDEGPLMRERPQTMRGPIRADRDAEAARHDMRPEYDPRLLINPGSLMAPEPRAGFVQRWISDGTNGGDPKDTQNFMKKTRSGWSPRDPSTVSETERRLYQTSKAISGEAVIRVAGLVLCEMPIQAANARKKALRETIQNQLDSVTPSMDELRKRGDDRIGPIKIESEEHAMRGRREMSATMVD